MKLVVVVFGVMRAVMINCKSTLPGLTSYQFHSVIATIALLPVNPEGKCIINYGTLIITTTTTHLKTRQ